MPNDKFGTDEAGGASNEKLAYQREIAAAAPHLVPPQFRYELSVRDTRRALIGTTLVAKGKVTVLHDAGTAALPSKAPTTVVATDGRDYTISYQNLLPAVIVQWPGAPPAPTYTLSVKSPAGMKQLTSSAPSFSFTPGSLSEGTHTLSIASSSGRISRVSRVVIRFDNAAPKAAITAPAEGGFQPGQSTRVAGISLPGWQVFAQGVEVPLDSEQRFSAQVTAGSRGLLLQFAHPSRGNHIYLRRAAGVER